MTGEKQTHEGPAAPHAAIELTGVNKSFGLVRANRDVNLRVEAGTIHGIVGENGAGKSTLMNILYGLHRADSGEMRINGKLVDIHSSADAIAHGIGMVHQHFMLVPNFTVAENVMLGTEGGALLAEGREKTLEILAGLAADYGMDVDPDAVISDLPVGIRQRVEIIKALKGGARIIILDEPTGVLTPGEADKLFDILRVLREDGVTVLLITHKLAEIAAVTDNVSIMRNGTMVGHRKTSETDAAELAELMVGRKVLLNVERGEANPGEVLLSVDNLSCRAEAGNALLQEISFEVRAGEILGVAGVAGNGQTELQEVLTGIRHPDTGTIEMLGKSFSPATPFDPLDVRKTGVGHIPEDRHHQGLVLGFEARENTILGYHLGPVVGDGLLMDTDRITGHCRELMDHYDVRPTNPALLAKNFSGGNQQKLVIAREMNAGPKVLVVGQPTRGVDIGAIEFIHKQIIALRDQGCAILLVSVELEEILGLSDRVMVMNAGRIVGIVDRDKADLNTLGLMMAGVGLDDAA